LQSALDLARFRSDGVSRCVWQPPPCEIGYQNPPPCKPLAGRGDRLKDADEV